MKATIIAVVMAGVALATPTEELRPRQTGSSLSEVTVEGNGKSSSSFFFWIWQEVKHKGQWLINT